MNPAAMPRVGPRATLVALAVLTGLTVLLTWPQARYMSSHVASHVDPFFSMWRLGWVAHALPTQPVDLFDANVFHPAQRTLAMSDAMLLEGILGAPLHWAGLPPVFIYNLLLLTGIVGSGMGMFVLARHLTGTAGPALVSAVIFALAPYRFEHYMHLELQWAMWIPLALWALHRAVEERSTRFCLWAGLFLWLQILSSVYYGVFLAMTMAIAAPLLLLGPDLRKRAAVIPRLMLAALMAGVLAFPYAMVYTAIRRSLGSRDPVEIATYSARPLSYLASPPHNWLWGWTAERWGGAEINLFPGALAILLVIVALWFRPRRLVLVYLVLAAATIELSLGSHGRVYPWLLEHVGPLQGLRAPSRFGIVALCAIAMLAGFGMHALRQRLRGRLSTFALAFAIVVLAAEYRSREMVLGPVADQPPDPANVYALIARLGPGVVMELPMPRLDRLPGFDAQYAFWSARHWHPLVNGYSGYYPPEYVRAILRTEGFPREDTVDFAHALGVRYIVVHRAYYQSDEAQALVSEMLDHPRLEYVTALQAPSGDVDLFIVSQTPRER